MFAQRLNKKNERKITRSKEKFPSIRKLMSAKAPHRIETDNFCRTAPDSTSKINIYLEACW